MKFRCELVEPSTGHRAVLSGEKAPSWSAVGENDWINEGGEEEESSAFLLTLLSS